MNKTRWLLWSAALVIIAAGFSVLHVAQDQPLATSDFDSDVDAKAPYILDTTNRLESFCPLHRAPMYVGKVPVAYGLPMMETVRAERFPHSRAIYQAGCVELPATSAWVYICPDCQRAENQWKLAQQPQPPR